MPRSFTEELDDTPETPSPAFDHLMRNVPMQDSEPDPDEGKDSPPGPEPGAHRGHGGYGKQWISSDAAFKLVLEVLWDEVVKPVIEILHLRVCGLNLLYRRVTHHVSFTVEVRRSLTNSVLVSHRAICFPSHPRRRPI